MKRRTGAILAVVSAATFGAVPAYGYWAGAVTVEVAVQVAQLTAPPSLETVRRSANEPGIVELNWQAPVAGTVPADGYLVERAALDSDGEPAEKSWRPVEARIRCRDGDCGMVDAEAPGAAAYRVTSLAGDAWTSAPSPVSRSFVIPGSRRTVVGAEPITAGCVDDAAPWTFPVPATLRSVDRPRVRLALPVAGQLVQRRKADGTWTDLGSIDAAAPLELTARVLTGDLTLRFCRNENGAAAVTSALLLVDG